MTIDIVMPVRNAGRLLRPAVYSVVQQTFTEWRLLAIDDGSTDDSADFLRDHPDDRVKLLPSRGSGIVAALNTGLAHVRAPYVARMDADDVCSPERLERQLDVISRGAVLALGTDYTIIDGAGDSLGVQRVPTAPAEIRRALARTNPFCHGSLVMRAEALERIGGYRDDYPLAEDYDLLLRLGAVGDLANLDEALYGWRLTPGSSSVRRAREQAWQSARARTGARAAGLIGPASLRNRLDSLLLPPLAGWERIQPPSEDLVMARRRAGLRWGNRDALGAIREYDAVLRHRPTDLAARLRRRRARAEL